MVAATVAVAGFALTWLLPGLPLRTTAEADGLGESFATPRDDDSLREIERAISVLGRRDHRWELYERLARRAGIALPPPQLWLLARLGEPDPLPEDGVATALRVDAERVTGPLAGLRRSGLVSSGAGAVVLRAAGRVLHERFVTARREALRDVLHGWEPDEHPELRRAVDRLARSFVSEMPAPAAV